MQIDILTPNDHQWQKLAEQYPSDIYHLPEYSDIVAKHDVGGNPMAFLAEDGPNFLFLPLIVRNCSFEGRKQDTFRDAISPYGYPGPLIHAPEDEMQFIDGVSALLVETLKNLGIVSFFGRLHPLLNSPKHLQQLPGTFVQHGHTISVDLTLPEHEIWSGIRSGHRTEISKSNRLRHLAMIDSEWKHWEAFKDIYRETMQKLGASDSYHFSDAYFEGLRTALKERLHLGVVLIDDEVAAASLFTSTHGITQYHLSGTRSDYRRFQPTKVLLHHAILWAKSRGDTSLHLGGGLGGSEDSLFRFKSGFSKRVHPFHTWRLIVNQQVYAQLSAGWREASGTEPDPIDGFFPAYRRPLPDTHD